MDLETEVRGGLEAFAAETMAAAAPPSAATIALRAGRRSVARRRRAKLAVAVVVGTSAMTGAAAAVGVLPAPVESMLDEFRSWGFGANQGAERVASEERQEFAYELWVAPLDGGGRCVSVRVRGPEGEVEHGGASMCVRDVPVERSRGAFQDLTYPGVVTHNADGRLPGAAGHAVASGRLPLGAVEVAFAFDDGTTLDVQPERDGYFLTTFPGVRTGVAITSVQALAEDGTVVARV